MNISGRKSVTPKASSSTSSTNAALLHRPYLTLPPFATPPPPPHLQHAQGAPTSTDQRFLKTSISTKYPLPPFPFTRNQPPLQLRPPVSPFVLPPPPGLTLPPASNAVFRNQQHQNSVQSLQTKYERTLQALKNESVEKEAIKGVVKSLQDTKSTLERHLTILRSELKKMKEKYEKDNSEASTHSEKVLTQNKELGAEVERLKLQLATLSETLDLTWKQKDKLDDDRHSLTQTVGQLSDQVKALKQELDQKGRNYSDIRKKLQQSESESNTLKDKLAKAATTESEKLKLEAAHKETNVQFEKLKKELLLKTGELKEYKHGKAKEIKKLKRDLDNFAEENLQLKSRSYNELKIFDRTHSSIIQEKENIIASLTEKNDKLENDILNVSKGIEGHRNELQMLEIDLSTKNKKLDEQEKLLEEKNRKIALFQHEKQQQNVGTLEEALKKNSALLQQQHAEIDKLTKEVDCKAAAIKSKDEQLQQQKAIIEQQSGKLEKLEDEVDTVKGESKAYLDLVDQCGLESKLQQDKIVEMEKALKALQQNMDLLQQQNIDLKGEMDSKSQELAEANGQKEQVEKSKDAAEIVKLKEELKEQNEKKEEIGELMGKNELLQNKYDELKKRLKTKSGQLYSERQKKANLEKGLARRDKKIAEQKERIFNLEDEKEGLLDVLDKVQELEMVKHEKLKKYKKKGVDSQPETQETSIQQGKLETASQQSKPQTFDVNVMDWQQKFVGMEALLKTKEDEIKKLSDDSLCNTSLNAELSKQNKQLRDNATNNVATISKLRQAVTELELKNGVSSSYHSESPSSSKPCSSKVYDDLEQLCRKRGLSTSSNNEEDVDSLWKRANLGEYSSFTMESEDECIDLTQSSDEEGDDADLTQNGNPSTPEYPVKEEKPKDAEK